MALQMATNISPDSLNGVGGGLFDASEGLTVSWQVNGSSPMLAYRIRIMENDANSTELYNTGKVTLSEPVYGVAYDGTVNYFSATEISAADLASANITNGNTYKMQITQWWGATDTYSVTQSSAALIEGFSAPTLTMSAVSNPLTTRNATFTATFAQSEGDTVSWVRWRIALTSDLDNPLVDTGNIFGTSELKAEYDAFFTGNNYSVKCDVGTQAGQEATTGWVSFNVAYATSSSDGLLDVSCRCDSGAIAVSWTTARSNVGSASGTYTIGDGAITLNASSTVTWDTENNEPISYAPDYTIIWKGIPRWRNGGELFTITTESGELQATISAPSTGTAKIEVLLGGVSIGSITTSTPNVYLDRTWMLIITNTTAYVQYIEQTGGLYPSDTQYPSDSLYPQPSTSGTPTSWSFALSYTQSTIMDLTLIGKQVCDFFAVVGSTMDASDIQNALSNVDYEPAWGSDMLFLAAFESGLDAGNLNTTGYTLFRQNITTGEYIKIGEYGLDTLAVIDYSTRNNNTYVYQLWYTDSTTFVTQPLLSEEITPYSWNYQILACSERSTGGYELINHYSFGANVSTGKISNNNAPKVQKNFTRYPHWQSDTSLYKSGRLTALIGNVNRYYSTYTGDTTAYADELMALSTTEYTLFLRDRKGDLIKIRPSGSISMQIQDNWPTQSMQIEFPWVEVGSADGEIIALTPADDGWPEDEIINSSVDVDIDTGELIWTYPEAYSTENSGSGLELSSAGVLTQESSAWYKPAEMEITDGNILTATTESEG